MSQKISTSGKLYPAPTLSRLHIEPSHGWVSLRLHELWEYRELLYFLTWRDIMVRYKQTLLGVTWAIIQPFMTMVVFSLFFGRLANIPSDNIPYPIFAYTALVPWTFFANGLSQASNSLVSNSNLLKKVYFPRLVIPLSGVLGGLPDFALSFLVLIGMMLFYGLYPSLLSLLWLPVFLLLALISALGVGLWLAALNVEYRDIRYIVPFLVQFWLFATPIAYPATLVKNDFLRLVYGLNPMVGVVEGFRWALLSGEHANQVTRLSLNVIRPLSTSIGHPPDPVTFVSVLAALLILVSGLFYFRRMEKSFADVV